MDYKGISSARKGKEMDIQGQHRDNKGFGRFPRKLEDSIMTASLSTYNNTSSFTVLSYVRKGVLAHQKGK